jgi:hypothetical protein
MGIIITTDLVLATLEVFSRPLKYLVSSNLSEKDTDFLLSMGECGCDDDDDADEEDDEEEGEKEEDRRGDVMGGGEGVEDGEEEDDGLRCEKASLAVGDKISPVDFFILIADFILT